MREAIRVFALGLIAACLAALPAAAQSYKVEKVSDAAPSELSAAMRDAVSGEALRVSDGANVLCEIWLRKSVPVLAKPVTDLGITFGQIAEGTFVGAIRFPQQVQDFRNQPIGAGVYTLRYALIPVDGNHVGVSQQRDFLLISPAGADTDPATITRDETLDLSRKATGTNHPSPWSLMPLPGAAPAAFPAMVHQQEDSDIWILEFQLTPASGGPVPMGLVVAGHSPEV